MLASQSIAGVPSKAPPFIWCLRCLLLIPYVLIWCLLSLLSIGEWLVRHLVCGWGGSRQLLFTSMRRKIAKELWIYESCCYLEKILLPSAVIRESEEHKRHVQSGNEILDGIEEEIKYCKIMLSRIREERREMQKLIPTPLHADVNYLESLSQSQRLRDHLKMLQQDAKEVLFYSRTQAVFDRTGYYGFADWAEKISKLYEHILVSVAQVAFIGATLTYGSIFSSIRGNIGIMCYAFALFGCGFIIPTVALALLKWASLRPKEAMFGARAPQLWRALLNIFVTGSVAAVCAAICLLNVSLIALQFPGANGDAGLQYNIAPSPAGCLALVCIGLAVLITLVVRVFHYLANDFMLQSDTHRSDPDDSRKLQEHAFSEYVLA